MTIKTFRSEADPFSAFEPEDEIRYKTQRRPPSNNPGVLVILLAVGVISGILALTYLAVRAPSGTDEAPVTAAGAATEPMGQAQFDSRPSGADVAVDGVVRGKTPLKLSLPVGSHTLEIRGEAGTRSLPLVIEAGVLVSQYVELVAAPQTVGGRIDIASQPAGAQVRVDGVVRGVTPLTLDAVEAGTHRIALSRGGNTIYRNVRVTPGATASVFASLATAPAAPGALGGFVSVISPIELQVLERGRLLGTSNADRLMLPTGTHRLELVSAEFQFQTTVEVDVEPGKTAAPEVVLPNGAISINALPWADVFVDGRSVGTTPLANLTVPIGSHEITWRHPQLGERRRAVTVTAQTPVRVGVDFAQ